jgi:hypothetical protein
MIVVKEYKDYLTRFFSPPPKRKDPGCEVA